MWQRTERAGLVGMNIASWGFLDVQYRWGRKRDRERSEISGWVGWEELKVRTKKNEMNEKEWLNREFAAGCQPITRSDYQYNMRWE